MVYMIVYLFEFFWRTKYKALIWLWHTKRITLQRLDDYFTGVLITQLIWKV